MLSEHPSTSTASTQASTDTLHTQAQHKDAAQNELSGVDESASVKEIKQQNNEFIARLTPLEVC